MERRPLKSTSDQAADSPIGHLTKTAPIARDTLRLAAQAMACEFAVIMNGEERAAIWENSSALDMLVELEQQMSSYRADSELSEVNALAATKSVAVDDRLFRVVKRAVELSATTGGAFDSTSGPLIQLWRVCRDEKRVPSAQEIANAQLLVGSHRIELDKTTRSIRFAQDGLSINLGAIGKGFALDEMMPVICRAGTTNCLLHGGRSSLLASGKHHGCHGWPVGIGNPLITNRRLGTIVLQDQAMSTSGSNIQYFRVGDRRFGHILDPRTGWPPEGMLSVTVVADSAADADALSTAFFVMKLDDVAAYCQAHPEVGAIVVPFPVADRRVQPQIYNVDPAQLYWDPDQVRIEK